MGPLISTKRHSVWKVVASSSTPRRSWDFCAKEGFYIGPALDSYRCFKLVKMDTKSHVILDTVKFPHRYPHPLPTTELSRAFRPSLTRFETLLH
jgi:hypothetical protein